MTDNPDQLLERVASDPKVSGGEPCIRGTRIHVAVVLDSLKEGLSPQEIVKNFPPLTEEDVRAVVVYSAQSTRKVPAESVPNKQQEPGGQSSRLSGETSGLRTPARPTKV